MIDVSRSPGLRAAIKGCTPLQALRMRWATVKSLAADEARSAAYHHRAVCSLLVDQARRQLAQLLKKSPPIPSVSAADINAARQELAQRVRVLAKADQQLAEAAKEATTARAVMCSCWSKGGER